MCVCQRQTNRKVWPDSADTFTWWCLVVEWWVAVVVVEMLLLRLPPLLPSPRNGDSRDWIQPGVIYGSRVRARYSRFPFIMNKRPRGVRFPGVYHSFLHHVLPQNLFVGTLYLGLCACALLSALNSAVSFFFLFQWIEEKNKVLLKRQKKNG